MSETIQPTGGGWKHTFAAVALVAAHFAAMLAVFEPVSSGMDSNAYYKQAVLIAGHGRTWFERESPMQFVGPHWVEFGDGRFIGRYPPGLPAVLAAVYATLGETAMFLVNPALTSLTLLGFYLLCRLWTGPGWALAAMALMAANPVANMWTFMGDAHPAVAFCLVWGLYLLARWGNGGPVSAAFSAGLVLGLIPTFRYAEALCAPAIAVFMLLHRGRHPRWGVSIAAAAVGAAMPMSAMLVHNLFVYGSLWRTGYELGGSLFTINYFFQKVFSYPANLLIGGVGLFFGLGLAGMILMTMKRESRPGGILLLGIVAPVTVMYMAYFFDDASMRFLMPTFYLYILAGVWFIRWLPMTDRGKRRTAAAVIGLTLVQFVPQSIMGLTMSGRANAMLASAARAADGIPAGSLLIAPVGLQQHLDAAGHWRLADEQYFTGRPMMGPGMKPPGGPEGGPGGPDGEILRNLMRRDEVDAIRERYAAEPGGGLPSALVADMEAWTGGREFYWLGNREDILEAVGGSAVVESVTKVDMPDIRMGGPGMGGPEGGGGPPRMGGPSGGPGMNGPGGRPGGPPGGGPGMMSFIGGDLVLAKIRAL